jgi:IS30 family transposase
MRRKHLTQDERAAIIESYHLGEKISVISAVFRRDEKTIYRVVRRADVPIRWYRNSGRRLHYAQRIQINAN